MSAGYVAVGWSPGKKRYDLAVAVAVAVYLAAFAGVSLWLRPEITAETLLIRGFGTVAFALLHVVLAIGPLARLDRRFLPLLWNRRHLGVTMFACALAHGGLALFQFHALGDRNPLVSLLTANTRFASLADFPFQQLGFGALVILFLMAATSHDFWLANLTAPVWKALHMLVYVAYALLVGHVALGALQDAASPGIEILFGGGAVALIALHVAAAWKGRAIDREIAAAGADGFVEACRASAIREKRARIVTVAGERVAIFRYDGKLSAVSNVCQHQNGPLGEGRILDGCITCPWHGYQYRPADGRSPEPFTERVPTFRLKLVDGDRVFVDPRPLPAGTFVEPVEVGERSSNKGEARPSAADDFFVGYLPVPPRIARFARGVAAAAIVGFGALGALLAAAQEPLGAGRFEFNRLRVWTGVLRAHGVLGIWPEATSEKKTPPFTSAFHSLVGEGKHGPPADLLDRKWQKMEIQGHLIHRYDKPMIEVVLARDLGPAGIAGELPPVPLGRHRLRGEIVDSKCFLGVMKPGQGKVHRDCAVRCISGGAPPMFVVRGAAGSRPDSVLLFWLRGVDGRAIGDRILDFVAEPVEAEGEVTRSADELIFAIDPAGLRRIDG